MRTFILSLSLLLLAQAPAQAEVVAREGKGWLEKRADGQRVLHLKGSAYEMGFQQGKLLAKAIKTNMERIVDNKGKLGKTEHYKLYKSMRGMMHDLLRKHIPKRFKEEMRGVADGAGVPYKDVEAGNLFPAAFHCSGIALKGKATAGGTLLHVRILDYMTRLGLQDNALVIVHEPDGYAKWLNVGFAGFIGSVTGMNVNQVAIGEMGGGGLLFWDGMPMAFLIRDALERAKTRAEAVKIFRTTKRTCEYYYVISDGKDRSATGIWATPQAFETIAPGEKFAFLEKARVWGGAAAQKAFIGKLKMDVGKHRILFRGKDAAGKHKIKGFIAMPPKDSLILSGYDRYQHFINRLVKHYGKVTPKLLQEMVKRPVSMKSNLHVAIFQPETLEVWVAVAAKDGSPACNQPYYRYRLETKAASKARAWTERATRLVDKGDHEQAERLLESALEADPKGGHAYVGMAYLQMRKRPRKLRKAVAHLGQALAQDGTLVDAYFQRAVCFYELSRFGDAIKDLAKVNTLLKRGVMPNFAPSDVALVRGHCHFQRRELDEAKVAYREFVKRAGIGHRALPKIKQRLAELGG